jgi:hypothetical protein
MSKELVTRNESRRHFVKKAAYIAPVVLTLQATSRFARAGSSQAEETNRRETPFRVIPPGPLRPGP